MSDCAEIRRLDAFLPPFLTERGVGLRMQTKADASFLYDLYASTRWEETAAFGWPDAQRDAFLRQQFACQTLHYDRHYAEAHRWIVAARTESIGRLYLLAMADDLRIVDISLLPPYRGRGIGGALIAATIAIARERGGTVTLHVAAFNPARRLYERLGFVPDGETDGVRQRMIARI